MDLSDLFEIGGLATFVAAIFVLAGLGGGLIAVAASMFLLSFALEGNHIDLGRAWVSIRHFIRSRLSRNRDAG